MNDLEKKWDDLVTKLEKKFDDEMSLKGILYLIGIQELNFGVKRFSKEEKVNVLHVATCKLLSMYGFYKFDSVDKDGWPHYSLNSKLPKLKPGEQSILMKESIISYFLKKGFLTFFDHRYQSYKN